MAVVSLLDCWLTEAPFVRRVIARLKKSKLNIFDEKF